MRDSLEEERRERALRDEFDAARAVHGGLCVRRDAVIEELGRLPVCEPDRGRYARRLELLDELDRLEGDCADAWLAGVAARERVDAGPNGDWPVGTMKQ